ncbi:MAG: efflux RND transporter periplasmic adaptor subunit [Planctomycetes bacterium]|nr:efflux RND transporter periplasmic adaptor subunit [Planctomycetota bacterium]
MKHIRNGLLAHGGVRKNFDAATGSPRRSICEFRYETIICAGMLFLGLGCRTSVDAPPVKKDEPQTVAVTTIKPERRTLSRVIEQPAHIEAFEEAVLLPRISGYVHKVNADIGDRVTGPRHDAKGKLTQAGQVLAEIFVPEMEEELKQKRALVVQAQAEVEQATAALEAAEANVTTAKAGIREVEAARIRARANCERWESQHKRMTGLVTQRIVDQQNLEETLNQYKSAEAACLEVEAKIQSAQATAKESEAKRKKVKADQSAARAKVHVAEAEAGRLAAMLDYSKIRAPFDGVVARRNVHTGHFLQPGSGSGATPLFVVARMDVVRVLVDVPEADAAFVSDGVPVRIRCQMANGHEIDTKVTRSSWSLDPKSRTLRAEIDLPNRAGKLRPGMYAYAIFRAELPNRLSLPVSAITGDKDQPGCYIVENGKAVRTPLQLGMRDGSRVEVLKKLVRAGGVETWRELNGHEAVIRENVAGLSDGQAVQSSAAP